MLYQFGQDQDVGEWQAQQGTPMDKTRELLHVNFEYCMPPIPKQLAEEVGPNLPWAEKHFKERVGGKPLNPPPSHVEWPFAQKDNEQHTKDEKFSHTYPERMWPKQANVVGPHGPASRNHGIRFEYGDLQDLIDILAYRPNTRQAYLPIWFPEDLHAANHEHERVPCTLGYHFIRRNGKLDITYHIRSCDLFRHFKDDVYMACRLCQWVYGQLLDRPQWQSIVPGSLVMNITSLHVFKPEAEKLKEEAGL